MVKSKSADFGLINKIRVVLASFYMRKKFWIFLSRVQPYGSVEYYVLPFEKTILVIFDHSK